jgi:hypothetical protein
MLRLAEALVVANGVPVSPNPAIVGKTNQHLPKGGLPHPTTKASPAGCSGPINGARGWSMEYVATAASLLSAVAGSFAAVIFGRYGIA